MILFTYENVTIRDYDLNFMNDKEWLNDQCISFYIAYLKNSKKDCISKYNVFLMEPQFSALISYC
jgi:Ulp1 family protease